MYNITQMLNVFIHDKYLITSSIVKKQNKILSHKKHKCLVGSNIAFFLIEGNNETYTVSN